MATSIEWTRGDDGSKGETWNPTVGCSKVSPGCDHCYAVTVAQRGMQDAHRGLTADGDWTGEVRLLPDRLDTPLHWRKPRRVFVDSMSDLFHPAVPVEFVEEVWATMAGAPQHTFQVLTKRPQRMADWFSYGMRAGMVAGAAQQRQIPLPKIPMAEWWPLPNVWLGTSIESDRYTFRADHLRATPAAVRFLSLEPLLGPLPSLNLDGIDWVIAGGESGPGARPMHPDWVRDLRDRCQAAGVAFFFKQWGAWGFAGHDAAASLLSYSGHWYPPDARQMWLFGQRAARMANVGKKVAGRMLDGRTWDEFPGGS